MKATEQYFPVVLFIMLYKVVLTFKPVDEILKCDHSNESSYMVASLNFSQQQISDIAGTLVRLCQFLTIMEFSI